MDDDDELEELHEVTTDLNEDEVIEQLQELHRQLAKRRKNKDVRSRGARDDARAHTARPSVVGGRRRGVE